MLVIGGVLLFILIIALILPISAAALTNAEAIAIFAEVGNQIRLAGRDAYCAAGITALCP